ncbi:MAG: hypothetical protein M3Y24_13625 [Acidobacteriota bacterium]|nr:hypothetical protein [Acidobacteriota bacterium]
MPAAPFTLEAMESPESETAFARQKLQLVRNTVLALHKALLDSERTAHELVHGSIASPTAFLQLLINDPRFAWLQPMTNLIVLIDETLAARKPPAEAPAFAQLALVTRALLSPSTDPENDFWKRYSAAIARDPVVSVLHEQVQQELK